MLEAETSKRPPRRHHFTFVKRGVPKQARYETATDKALLLLWPWPIDAYPGAYKGAVRTFHGKAAAETIRAWRRGRRRTPQWARDILLDQLRQRASDIAKAIAALENEEARR